MYSKYPLCKSCYSKSKAGKVYIGEVTFPSGKKTLYTGQTKRPVYGRVREHINNQKYRKTKTHTGRGIFFRLIGSIFSNNRFKAEKTIKKLPRKAKLNLAKKAAKKYKRSKTFWD